jgi:hypothetical protein
LLRKGEGRTASRAGTRLQQGFGALRTTYEAFIIYDLFNEVVKRFEERVSFDRLKEVSLDREVVEQVVENLGTLSRYIDAHLHSDIFAEEKLSAFDRVRWAVTLAPS